MGSFLVLRWVSSSQSAFLLRSTRIALLTKLLSDIRGAETVAHADKDFPTQTVAFSLLGGFMFMLLVEQFITGHSHSHSHHEHLSVPSETPQIRTQKSSAVGGTAGDVVFDVELGDLEQSEGIGPEFVPMPGSSTSQLNQFSDVSEKNEEDRKRAYPLTLGLVIHALADGLALGSAAIANGSAIPSGLSLVVFLALIVHKGASSGYFELLKFIRNYSSSV